MLSFRLDPSMRDAVDAWIASQPDPKPGRSEAIRIALLNWLTHLGRLKRRDAPEGANERNPSNRPM